MLTGTPTTLSITGAFDDVTPVTGEISNGGSTNDTIPTIQGSGADAGATITVYDGTTAIGTTTVEESRLPAENASLM